MLLIGLNRPLTNCSSRTFLIAALELILNSWGEHWSLNQRVAQAEGGVCWCSADAVGTGAEAGVEVGLVEQEKAQATDFMIKNRSHFKKAFRNCRQKPLCVCGFGTWLYTHVHVSCV